MLRYYFQYHRQVFSAKWKGGCNRQQSFPSASFALYTAPYGAANPQKVFDWYGSMGHRVAVKKAA